jgi:hypothetical protein
MDNLGKDKENEVNAWCGTCSTEFFNAYGYIVDLEHYKEVRKKYPSKKLPKPIN